MDTLFPLQELRDQSYKLAEIIELRRFKMGKTIFREGYSPNRTMYFVLRGRVAMVVSNKNTEQNLQGGSDDLKHHEQIRIQ